MEREEAIKIVKSHYPANKQMLNEALEFLIPELAESEDEKIREELIDYINRLTATPNNIDRYNSWISWLEKQGEMSKLLEDKDKLIKELGNYKVKYTQETLEKALTTNNKDDERLRKNTIAFLKDFADKGYENAVECIDWLEKQGEQKSTWSEEDEERIDRICDFVWKNRKGDTDEIYQQEQDVNWLKSLKERLS